MVCWAAIPSRVLLGSPSGPVFGRRVCGRFLDCLWNISISGCRIPDCKAQVFYERMDEVYKIGLLPRAPARSISCRTLHYVALAFPGRSSKVRSRCRWRRGRLRQTERRYPPPPKKKSREWVSPSCCSIRVPTSSRYELSLPHHKESSVIVFRRSIRKARTFG